jgi:hypothetical protein
VSATPEPERSWPEGWSTTAQEVDTLLRALPGVDLPTLESTAALLTRVDRKYVVPVETFARLVGSLDDGWRSLDVSGRRLFGYTSTYFDTADLATYRAHLQGRRRRFKVRIRRYDDTDSSMLEVKRKGMRGMTVKERMPYSAWDGGGLCGAGRAFVAEAVGGHAVLPDAELAPVVTTRNRRATLLHAESRSRLTVDLDLRCGRGEDSGVLREGFVLLESKAAGVSSVADRLLRSLGARPAAISKYCIGVAPLGRDLPTNPWRRTVRRYFDIPLSEEHPCPSSA